LQEFSIFFLKNREKVAFLWAFRRIFPEKAAKMSLFDGTSGEWYS